MRPPRSFGWPSTVRFGDWPAWFSFWFSGRWRALSKGTARAGFYRTVLLSTLHRARVGQGPPGHGWLAIAVGFWSGRALATGTAWAGLCLIHHHRAILLLRPRSAGRQSPVLLSSISKKIEKEPKKNRATREINSRKARKHPPKHEKTPQNAKTHPQTRKTPRISPPATPGN